MQSEENAHTILPVGERNCLNVAFALAGTSSVVARTSTATEARAMACASLYRVALPGRSARLCSGGARAVLRRRSGGAPAALGGAPLRPCDAAGERQQVKEAASSGAVAGPS